MKNIIVICALLLNINYDLTSQACLSNVTINGSNISTPIQIFRAANAIQTNGAVVVSLSIKHNYTLF
jgi:hypothetical protein